MRLDDLDVPDSAACVGAAEVASTFCSPALLNHSIRAYLFAAAYAGANGIGYDAELLYTAALLHDVGLVAEFDNHALPFEDAGGHVAWVFAAGAGWPVARRVRLGEVIVRHMWDEVDVAEDPEGHLLALSTGMDISGRLVETLPAELRADVLDRYPRLDLPAQFLACFRDQAARKPTSRAADLIRSGLADRITRNPLDG